MWGIIRVLRASHPRAHLQKFSLNIQKNRRHEFDPKKHPTRGVFHFAILGGFQIKSPEEEDYVDRLFVFPSFFCEK